MLDRNKTFWGLL